MNPYKSLPETERIRQIGELLAVAALRHLSTRPRPPLDSPLERPAAAKIIEVWDLVEDEGEKQLLRFIALNGAAQPVGIGRALHLTHPTLTRRLTRLRTAGLIAVSGKTRNAVYSLARLSFRN